MSRFEARRPVVWETFVLDYARIQVEYTVGGQVKALATFLRLSWLLPWKGAGVGEEVFLI